MNQNQFRVMIRFGDNDFGNTFVPVLLALRSWLQWSGLWEEHSDKQVLTELIAALSPIAYKHCQNYGRLDPNKDESTLDYVKIRSDEVLLGEEVDQHLANHMDQADHGWFILDMRIPVPEQQVFVV